MPNIDVLERFLSRERLVNADVSEYIKEREEEVKNADKEAKRLQSHYEGEIKKIEEQIEGLKLKITDLRREKKERIEHIWKSLRLEALYQQPKEKATKKGAEPHPLGVYVKAGDFDYKGDGLFELKDNRTVTLNVQKNSSNKNVKESLESQGCRNMNYNSFVYSLKVKAGYLG